MSANDRTCSHIQDTGGICSSAAVKNQRYCAYHLNHRARLMRMAQYRARHQRFQLRLPPLENMYAVQSALNHIFEAAAAGMIDLKQARFLLSVIRVAGQFLLRADQWQANPYHSDQSAEMDLVAQYGLPQDLDLDLAPEVAFPESTSAAPLPGPPNERGVCAPWGGLSPSFGDRVGDRTDNRPLTIDNVLDPPPLPHSGNYCGDHHSRECECLRIRADYPVTPEMIEVVEVAETCGSDVADARRKQLLRNSERRRLNRDRKHYAAIALEHNLRRAAERMAELKLAERARQESGCPTRAGVEVPSDAAKKPAASVPAGLQAQPETTEKATLSPTG